MWTLTLAQSAIAPRDILSTDTHDTRLRSQVARLLRQERRLHGRPQIIRDGEYRFSNGCICRLSYQPQRETQPQKIVALAAVAA